MQKSILELLVGDLDEKRVYRVFMKRVNALPSDYRYAFKRIQRYLYNFGAEMVVLTQLAELFEESAAQGKPVLDVIGSDVAAFCDELIQACAKSDETAKERLNQEIFDHFHREGK